MKNIKNFKYWYSLEFEKLLKDYGYTIDDVKGYSFSSITCYDGNILRTYRVYFYDGDHIYFSVAYFKSFDEYNKAWQGCDSILLAWYKISMIKLYKLSNEYIRD